MWDGSIFWNSVAALGILISKNDFIDIQIHFRDGIHRHRVTTMQYGKIRSTTRRRSSFILYFLCISCIFFVAAEQRDHGHLSLFTSLHFFKLRQHFHYNFVQKSSPLPLLPSFFFFSKWINEFRVFVCWDQYVVMKAALQFPAKESLSGSGWICFILYCYQPAYICFHLTSLYLFFPGSSVA